jgi:hypothetical protein
MRGVKVMTTRTRTLEMLPLVLVASGCSFYARSANDYRDATQAVLDTKTAEIRACYDTALKAKPDLAGTLTVHFVVAKSSGKFTNVTTTTAAGPAPAPLDQCVVSALSGLELRPADRRDGDATFEYEFVAKK